MKYVTPGIVMSSLVFTLCQSVVTAQIVVDVQLDLSEYTIDGERPVGIGLIGSPAPLGLDVSAPAILLSDIDGDHVWEGSFTLNSGLVEFKFVYDSGAYYTVESTPGGVYHTAWLRESEKAVSIHLAYDKDSGAIGSTNSGSKEADNVLAEFGTTLTDDEIKQAQLGDALWKVINGDLTGSEAALDGYKTSSGKTGNIDYDILYSQELSNAGDYESALDYITSRQIELPTGPNNDALRLQEAFIYEDAGSAKAAREVFSELARSTSLETASNARLALAQSKIASRDSVFLDEAKTDLLAWLGLDDIDGKIDTSEILTSAFTNDAQLHNTVRLLRTLLQSQGDTQGVYSLAILLDDVGNENQKSSARLDQVKEMISRRYFTAALGHIEATRKEMTLTNGQLGQLLYHEAEAYFGLRQQNAALSALETLVAEYPDTRYAGTGRKTLDRYYTTKQITSERSGQ